MVSKHIKNCPVPFVPTTVVLQVKLYEVLGKHRILPDVKIIIWNSAHKITSFRVFVINIIKMNFDWKNCHHYQHSRVHLFRECRRLCLSPSHQLYTLGCVRSTHESCSHLKVFRISFFYLSFLSQITFTNHRTAGEGGGHYLNSLLRLPTASQSLRH